MPIYYNDILSYYFLLSDIFCTFAAILVYNIVIKRELGENPKQSRCCKLVVV